MVDAVVPKTLLVAALGGEGGGVLTSWIVQAAMAAGLPAQATSVPGVAQRTGATSYYVEYLPEPAPDGLEPILALVPTAGRIDCVISSELLEAGRLLERGFVSPDRTLFISSSSRVLTTIEKLHMGDGRYDGAQIHETARELAKTYVSLDLEKMAQEHGTVISATMFGALAGSGALAWEREVCEEVIRSGGRGVAASLAGFAAAFEAAQANLKSGGAIEPSVDEAPKAKRAAHLKSVPEVPADFSALPQEVRDLIGHGVARCTDFLDEAYSELFLERMRALVSAAGTDSGPQTAHALGEAARRLALWMAYEDIPRVADLKTRAERFERIREEAEAQPEQIVRVYEYLKPGAAEIADMMPKGIGGWIMRRVEAGKSLPFLGRGMAVSTTSVTGHFALKVMAAFGRIRRKSLRFAHEQEAIGRWLDAMGKSLARSPDFAGALAELPRLLKGYGETQARGRANYDAIFEAIVMPAIADGAEQDRTPWLRRATGAALADPESEKLAQVLAEGADGKGTAAIAAQ